MKFIPHDYQQDIIDHVKDKPGSMVLAQMGSGKTAAMLEALKHMTPRAKRVLIVAPLRVAKFTWPNEIAKWENFANYKYEVAIGTVKQRKAAIDAKAPITIINTENLVWLVEYLTETHGWVYDTTIIDESSMFKSNASKRFKTIKRVVDRVPHRVVLLTATPTPNSMLELWPQVYLIDKGKRLGKNLTAYRNRWFLSDYMGYNWTLKPGAKAEIQAKVADLSVVVESYAGLPARVDLIEQVDMPRQAWDLYDELKEHFTSSTSLEDITAANAAVLVGKLAQVASGSIYDEARNVHCIHNEKLDALESIVDQAGGENILVAYNYVHELSRIKSRFPHARVLGEDNTAIDDWNAGKIKMLVAHPKSAAHGLNLQDGGKRIVWYSPTWSNELKMQFDARLHRQGQKDTVFIHTIVARNTIDEEIIDALNGKRTAQEILLRALKR